uniref:Reverse transcriptase domain-containing protein n=1 Tax=Tanacetum cinerariifolium TaxID=118510 RepID=A0A6L2JYQ9_TANCI|nr:reverse transcriptase domain-containing protein [Tanacetum cinerariifolium]
MNLVPSPNQSTTDDLMRQERPQGALLKDIIPNPRKDIKSITTRGGIVLAGPSVPPSPLCSYSKEPSPSFKSYEIPLSPSSSPSDLPKRNPHQPLIPYPSKLNKEKLQDKSDIQVHKFLHMFKKLHFNISLAEALALMPKYAKMLKDPLSDKEKLLGFATTSLTKNYSAIFLKKLLEKLRDPRKFLIPCDFPELEKCMALADLDASISLMPLFVWKKLMLPELVPTRMTLELANQSVAYPSGIAKDIFVQVGKFTFPADFVVVDYDIDPRVPLILGRPFLRMAFALVDKSIHHFSGSTASLSDSFPSLMPFKASDSLLEEFTDELALIESFLSGNDDIHFDDNNEEIDPIFDEFIDDPSLVDSFPSEKDDDLFDLENDNDEWRYILYHDPFDDIHSKKDKIKDSKMKILVDELESPESNSDEDFSVLLFLPQGQRNSGRVKIIKDDEK